MLRANKSPTPLGAWLIERNDEVRRAFEGPVAPVPETDPAPPPPAPEVDWELEKIKAICGKIRSSLESKPSVRRKVFVDCGFNTCKVLGKFLDQLGPDFEAYGFDILEELAPIARRVEFENPGRVRSLEIAAVSDNDGVLPFFEVTTWGPNFKGGSSIMDSYLAERRQGLSPKQVRSLDFSAWMARKFEPDDFVVIKMDIEGAEYAVLEKMLADGTLALAQLMIVEFHWPYFDPEVRDAARARHDKLMEGINKANPTLLFEWH